MDYAQLLLILLVLILLVLIIFLIYKVQRLDKPVKPNEQARLEQVELLPRFYGKIIDRNDVVTDGKRKIKFKLMLTNESRQTAEDVNIVWDGDDMNWFEWNVEPGIQLELSNATNFGSVKHNDCVLLHFECKVPIHTNAVEGEGYFAFLALELTFRQPDGQQCTQIITWLDYSQEFDWLDCSFVERYSPLSTAKILKFN